MGYPEIKESVVSILIVEDNPDHATLAQAAFERHDDWSIETVGSLEKAFAAVCKRSFDVVLLDYVLPDGLGLDLLDWVKKNSAVIMMTSQGSEQIAVESLRRGALNYVVKDCLFRNNLLDAVEEALYKRQVVESALLN